MRPHINQVATLRSGAFFTVSLLLVVVGYFYLSTPAAGATYTWDGGGATDNWSDCDNWTSNTCPGAADIARFDGTNTDNSIVDASFAGSVLGVDINVGYTGTVTQARNLTIGASNFDQAAGTWVQNTFNLDINSDGDLIVSGGTFQAGEGTNTIEQNITFSGGTLISSSTRVFRFDGNDNFSDGVLTYSGVFPATLGIAATLSPDFTIASGAIVDRVESAISLGSGLLFIQNGASLRIANNTVTAGSLTISGTAYASTTINLSANFTLGSTGVFVYDGSTINLEGSYTDNGGTFDATGITILMDGVNTSGTFTYPGEFPGILSINKTNSGGVTIASGTIIKNWGSFTDSGFFTVQNGAAVHLGNTAVAEVGSFSVSGAVTASSTINIVDNRLFLNSTGAFNYAGSNLTAEEGLSYSSGHTLGATNYEITIDGSSNFDDGIISTTAPFPIPIRINNTASGASLDITAGSDIILGTSSSAGPVTISGTVDTQGNNFTASSITLNSNATLKLHGDETITTPTIGENVTIEYTGTGTYSSLLLGTNYENLSFSGGGTYNIASSITVEDNFLSSNNSTFNQTSGTFTLDGTGNQMVTGTSTFTNFTATAASPRTISFGANQTQTISGTLTLTGADTANRLTINSTLPGTQWKIDPQGTRIVSALIVQDSYNTNITAIACDTDCVNNGNNTNWDIPVPPQVWRLQGDLRLQGNVRFGGQE